jgi:hypothetical protein
MHRQIHRQEHRDPFPSIGFNLLIPHFQRLNPEGVDHRILINEILLSTYPPSLGWMQLICINARRLKIYNIDLLFFRTCFGIL